MNKNMQRSLIAIGTALALVLLTAPFVAANEVTDLTDGVTSDPGAYCSRSTTATTPTTGTWSRDCTGMDNAGCIGQWGDKGHYTKSESGTMYVVDSSYSNTFCLPSAAVNLP